MLVLIFALIGITVLYIRLLFLFNKACRGFNTEVAALSAERDRFKELYTQGIASASKKIEAISTEIADLISKDL